MGASPPTLRQFAEATANVVADTPVDEYVPTFIYGGEVLVMEGIPQNVDHRDAIQQHAKRNSWLQRGFMFAVRSGHQEITLGECKEGHCEFALLRWTGCAAQLDPLAQPPWWWLSPNNSLERGRGR